MSRTTKLALTAILAVSALTAPAQAQDVSKAEILAALIKSKAAAQQDQDGTAAGLRAEIAARISQIMDEMDSAPEPDAGGAVTIDEIDQINRSAERERTALEFERARNERMQVELERMLALYEAAKAIEADAKAEKDAVTSAATALAASQVTPKGPEPADQEMAKLPRVASIAGVGGEFSADIQFEGQVARIVKIGEMIDEGFVVDDIQSSFVALKGPQTGKTYRLSPRAPEPVTEEGPMPVGGVLDLSQYPITQF